MREITQVEIAAVSGGRGTKIPFVNSYIRDPGPNWPGGYPTAVTMAFFAFSLGFKAGEYLNNRIAAEYDMTPGEAAYHTFKRRP